MQAELDVDDVVEVVEVDPQELLDVRQALLQRVAVHVENGGRLLYRQTMLEQHVECLVETGAVASVVLEERRERSLDDLGKGLVV